MPYGYGESPLQFSLTFKLTENNILCSLILYIVPAAATNAQNTRRSVSVSAINNNNPTKSTREIRQLRMFRAILVIMITFFVCRLPTWIFLLYKLFNVANSNFHWMLQYTFGLLSIFNCVLNPLLYTYLTETINCSFLLWDNFKSLYCCCCWRRPPSPPPPTQRRHHGEQLVCARNYNSPVDGGGVVRTTDAAEMAAAVKKSSFYFSEDNKRKMART